MTIENLINGATNYLLNNLSCDEDRLIHRGRLTAVWQMMAWLNERQYSEIDFKTKVNQMLTVYQSNLGTNKNGDFVIDPGSNVRRNYSTNAIDVGILLDSYFSLSKITQTPYELTNNINNIATTYAFNKLKKPTLTHNQYLWLCSGFSMWLANSNATEKYFVTGKDLVIKSIDLFISHSVNGYSPYSSDHSDLRQITTYYHSRCIAFLIYSLKNLKVESAIYDDFIRSSAAILGSMYTEYGYKNLSLETKRYYFQGGYECGSAPYDLYVFYQLFVMTEEEKWLQISHLALNRYLRCQNVDGGINSVEHSYNYDWQCKTMRTTHISWLTKIPDWFYSKTFKSDISSMAFLDDFNYQGNFFKIVSKNISLHFLEEKSPITPLNGQRAVGLIPNEVKSITNLFIRYPFEYRSISPHFQRFSPRELSLLKRSFLHFVDVLVFKRQFKKGLLFFKTNIVSFVLAKFFVKSTVFLLKISDLNKDEKIITHRLSLSRLDGTDIVDVGNRKIIFNDQLIVWDEIKSPKTLTLSIAKNTSTTINGKQVKEFGKLKPNMSYVLKHEITLEHEH